MTSTFNHQTSWLPIIWTLYRTFSCGSFSLFLYKHNIFILTIKTTSSRMPYINEYTKQLRSVFVFFYTYTVSHTSLPGICSVPHQGIIFCIKGIYKFTWPEGHSAFLINHQQCRRNCKFDLQTNTPKYLCCILIKCFDSYF